MLFKLLFEITAIYAMRVRALRMHCFCGFGSLVVFVWPGFTKRATGQWTQITENAGY